MQHFQIFLRNAWRYFQAEFHIAYSADLKYCKYGPQTVTVEETINLLEIVENCRAGVNAELQEINMNKIPELETIMRKPINPQDMMD